MDNIHVHEVAGVREAIDAKSAGVLYLSDFNPIEKSFSKIKSILQRTRDGLQGTIGEALRSFTPDEFICKLWTKSPTNSDSIRSTKCRD